MFYEEGKEGLLKMMLIGLYCWFVGCLGWVVVFKCFIEYVLLYEKVWVLCWIDIVYYWYEYYFLK